MAAPPTAWQLAAAASSSPCVEMAPVLAHALRMGLFFFETTRPPGAETPEAVRAMRGALQQWERALRTAEEARVVQGRRS